MILLESKIITISIPTISGRVAKVRLTLTEDAMIQSIAIKASNKIALDMDEVKTALAQAYEEAMNSYPDFEHPPKQTRLQEQKKEELVK